VTKPTPRRRNSPLVENSCAVLTANLLYFSAPNTTEPRNLRRPQSNTLHEQEARRLQLATRISSPPTSEGMIFQRTDSYRLACFTSRLKYFQSHTPKKANNAPAIHRAIRNDIPLMVIYRLFTFTSVETEGCPQIRKIAIETGCGEKTRKTPALVVLRRRATSGGSS